MVDRLISRGISRSLLVIGSIFLIMGAWLAVDASPLIGATITIVGVGLVFAATVIGETVADRMLSQSRAETAALEGRAQIAEQDLAHLKALGRDRRILPEQADKIVEAVAGSELQLTIVYSSGHEVANFVDDLAEAFSRAGAQVGRAGGGMMLIGGREAIEPGVALSGPSDAASEAVERALVAARIDFFRTSVSPLGGRGLTLAVGPKPSFPDA